MQCIHSNDHEIIKSKLYAGGARSDSCECFAEECVRMMKHAYSYHVVRVVHEIMIQENLV